MIKSLIGKKVYIKNNVVSWHAGQWGIVADIIDGSYHVAIAGDSNSTAVFERSELTVPKNQATS
jgi:hypothetical protein